MKIFKIILLVLVLALAAIQLIPDKMPANVNTNPGDIVSTGLVPDSVASILKTSCYDCHSNETQFPWYSRLAPASWLLARDIRAGREQMNFSEWGAYSKRERIGKLESVKEEVTSGEMPLFIYTIIHRQARLTQEQISSISAWTEVMANNIME
jgi:hypothetical protein